MGPMRPLLTTPSTSSSRRRRFPLRTLLLMVLALVAFARFWWITHRTPPSAPPRIIPVRPTPAPESRP
jgi:cytoskeletal protein RodZ